MNTRLKRENRGVLIIFILIIILFFSNIFGARGAITTEYDCTTLVVNSGTYTLKEDATYCYLDLKYGASLIIENGVKLTLTRENNLSEGSIYNYGEIDVTKFTFNYGYVSNHGDVLFYNSGDIIGDEINFYMTGQSQDNKSYLTLNCGSSITAGTIRLSTNEPSFKMNGEINSGKLTMYNGQGYLYSGNLIFDACSFVNTDILQIDGNINNIKIYGHIIAGDIISTKNMYVSDDNENNTSGILTIGNTSNNVKFVVDANSIMNLCFNPTVGGDDLGFCLGYLLYLSNETTNWIGDNNPEAEGDINNNNNKNPSNLYWTIRNDKNNRNPLYSKKIIAAYNSYNGCMAEKNMASFLPIELVSFEYKDGKFIWTTASETNNDYFVVEYSGNGYDWVECTEHTGSMSNAGYTYSTVPIIQINKSLFSYFRLKQVDLDGKYSYSRVIAISFFVENPCSDEYEDTKIQIRELRCKWFRRINGGLIYCDKDNQELH